MKYKGIVVPTRNSDCLGEFADILGTHNIHCVFRGDQPFGKEVFISKWPNVQEIEDFDLFFKRINPNLDIVVFVGLNKDEVALASSLADIGFYVILFLPDVFETKESFVSWASDQTKEYTGERIDELFPLFIKG